MSPANPANHWLQRLDVTGSFLSTVCAIHCLAMPLIAAALPVWGLAILGSRGWERFTAAAMVALAAFCLWQGCRRHGRWWLLLLLGAGAFTVLGTQFLWAEHQCADTCCNAGRDWAEAAFMFFGGLAIAASHFLNLHFRRRCSCRLCPDSSSESTRHAKHH